LKFVNPFTEFRFEKLFGFEPNKDLLIDLGINANIPRETIKLLTNLSDEILDKLYEQIQNS